MDNNDKSFPPVFFLESIFVKNGQKDFGEESFPYYEVDRVTDVCRTLKWVKSNMDCSRYGDRDKVGWYVTVYWSGWPIDKPARKILYKNFGHGVKRIADKIDYYNMDENRKLFAALQKNRQFNPGDIVRFLKKDRVYTGIIEEHILEISDNIAFIDNKTKYQYPDKYIILVVEKEGPAFYESDRIAIIEKLDNKNLRKNKHENYDYINQLKETYSIIQKGFTIDTNKRF